LRCVILIPTTRKGNKMNEIKPTIYAVYQTLRGATNFIARDPHNSDTYRIEKTGGVFLVLSH